MIRSLKTKTAALATVGALTLGGGAYAATSSSTAPTPLTGSITDQASEAALAKVPGGTLVGIESRPDGTYEARVRKSDGTQVSLSLSKTFEVTATRTGGGHGGPGGFGGGRGGRFDVAALAKTLGVTEAKLQAALTKVQPSKDDRGSERAAAIAKALGAETADVQAVIEAQRDAGGRGPRGDDSALVTAMAKATGKTESAVRTALRAARPDRTDRAKELAAALAKELGLDATKVQAALESARGARRP
jgi:hypothetical protein